MGREISIGDAARALDPVLDSHAPENEVVVLVDRSQELSARLHGNAVDGFLLKAKSSNELMCGHIPQADITVRTARSQQGAIAGEGQAGDRLSVSEESRQERPAGLYIPKSDRMLSRRGCQQLAVRTESHPHGHQFKIVFRSRRADLLAEHALRFGFPQVRLQIVSRRGQERSIGTEGERPQPVFLRGGGGASLLTSRQIPIDELRIFAGHDGLAVRAARKAPDGRPRYHGVFAPHSQYRSAVTPAQRGRGALRPPASDADPAKVSTPRHVAMSWARR